MKKLFCGALLAVMLTVTAAAATPADFTDFPIPENWAYTALENAVKNGLLVGRTPDQLVPKGELTRSEMAAMLNRAFGATVRADLTAITDVSPQAWYYQDMEKALQMQTFHGVGNHQMQPDRPITRQEAFTVVARALLLKQDPSAPALRRFDDSDQIADWARPAMSAMVLAGYVDGYGGKLYPRDNITRAEFAQMMDHVVNHYIEESDLHRDLVGNVMIRQAATLSNMTISGNLILGDGAGEAEVVLNNVKILGDLIVRGGGEHSVRLNGGTSIGGEVACGKTTATLRICTDTVRPDVRVAEGSKNVIVEGGYRHILLEASHADVMALNARMSSGIITGDESRIVVKEKSTLDKGEIYGDNSKIIVESAAKLDNGTIYGKDSQIIIEIGGKLTEGTVEKEADRSEIVIVGGGGGDTGGKKEDVVIGPGESGGTPPDKEEVRPALTADMVKQMTFMVPSVQTAMSTDQNRLTVNIDLTGCRDEEEVRKGRLDIQWVDGAARTGWLDPGYPGHGTFLTAKDYTIGEFIAMDTLWSGASMNIGEMRKLLDHFDTAVNGSKAIWELRARQKYGSNTHWPDSIVVNVAAKTATVHGQLYCSGYTGSIPITLILHWAN